MALYRGVTVWITMYCTRGEHGPVQRGHCTDTLCTVQGGHGPVQSVIVWDPLYRAPNPLLAGRPS